MSYFGGRFPSLYTGSYNKRNYKQATPKHNPVAFALHDRCATYFWVVIPDMEARIHRYLDLLLQPHNKPCCYCVILQPVLESAAKVRGAARTRLQSVFSVEVFVRGELSQHLRPVHPTEGDNCLRPAPVESTFQSILLSFLFLLFRVQPAPGQCDSTGFNDARFPHLVD